VSSELSCELLLLREKIEKVVLESCVRLLGIRFRDVTLTFSLKED
jgi:hypothetical protein